MERSGKLDAVFVELLNELNASKSLRQYKTLVDEYKTQKSQIDNKYEQMIMQAENDYSMQKNNTEMQYDQMINQAQNYVSQAKLALDQERQRHKTFGDDRNFLEKELGSSTASRARSKAESQLSDAKRAKKNALKKLKENHRDRLNSIEESHENEIDVTWDKFVNQVKPMLQENKSEIVNGFEEIFNTLNQMEDSFEKVNKFLELVATKIDNALAYRIVSLTDISDIINNTNMSDDLKYIENNYTELYKKNAKLYKELVESVDQLTDKKDILINVGSDIKEELDLLEKYLEIDFNDINNSSKYIYNNTGIFKQLLKDKDTKLSKLENIVNNYNVIQENKDLINKIVSIYEQIFQTLKEVEKYPILPQYNQAMANDSLNSNLKNIIKDTFNVINIDELNRFFDGNGYYTKDAENNYSSLISNNNTMNENINKVKDFIKSFNDNYDVFSQKVKNESKKKVVKYLLVSGFIIIIAIVSSLLYIENQEQQRLQRVSGYGDAIQYIENPSEAVQLAAVKQNGYAIRYIKNPSEAVQWAAVKQNAYVVEYIKNPTEAMLSELEAKHLEKVKKRASDIKDIKNPSEAVQLAAVKQSGYLIEYIKNPTEAVQLAAVKSRGDYIKYIKNPSEAVHWAAVKNIPGALCHIKNPSEALQLAAVKQGGYAIGCIKNPSEALQMVAVKQSGKAIKNIKNPSEAVQLAAVKQNAYAVDSIKNPSQAVQLAAVNQKAYVVRYIKNPSEAVQLAAVKLDPNVIHNMKNPTKAVKTYACPRTGWHTVDKKGRKQGPCYR